MEIWQMAGAPERITDEWLKEERGQRSRATREVLDKKGLFVRISVLGRIKFVARYQIARRTDQLTLGTFPEMGIEQARSERQAIQDEIRQGKDPKLTRRFVDPYRRQVATIEDLVWEYLDDWPQKSFSSENDVIAKFERLIFPALGKRRPSSVTKKEWLTVLSEAYRVDTDGTLEVMGVIVHALNLAVQLGVVRKSVLGTFYRDLKNDVQVYVEDNGNE